MSNPNIAFTLRIPLRMPGEYRRSANCIIRAYDDLVPQWDDAGRIRLTCEVRHDGKVVFPKGKLTCALHGTSDGIAARELVLSMVATRPGDTDADYFADYTPEQLGWVTEHGETLGMEAARRYCDQDGNVRKSA